MKCPCCDGEMLPGYLYNGSLPVQWIPEGEKPAMISFTTTDKGVTLVNRFSFRLGGYQAEAWHCPNCRMVMAPAKP